MALILERLDIRRPTDVLRRMMLERTPITIGRALDNDLVLDDPYVDAHHARIVSGDDGALALEDLGSVNGIDVTGVGRQERVTLAAGVSVRLGKTPLRIRDRAEDVAPAVPLVRPVSAATPRRWLHDPRWQIAVILLVLANFADSSWVATSDKDGRSAVLAVIVGLVMLMAMWAGAWAVASKIVIRRANFLVHVTIAAWSWAVVGVMEIVRSWGTFLLPALEPSLGMLSVVVTVAASAWNLYFHLTYATNLSQRARMTSVASIVGGIALLVGAFAAVADDAFTDVPEFLFGLKRAPAAIIPAGDLDDFRRAAEALRAEVDSLVTE